MHSGTQRSLLGVFKQAGAAEILGLQVDVPGTESIVVIGATIASLLLKIWQERSMLKCTAQQCFCSILMMAIDSEES